MQKLTTDDGKKNSKIEEGKEITSEGYQNDLLRIRIKTRTICSNVHGDIMLNEN